MQLSKSQRSQQAEFGPNPLNTNSSDEAFFASMLQQMSSFWVNERTDAYLLKQPVR